MKNTQHTIWEEILLYRPLRYIVPCGLILLVVWLCVMIPKWGASFKDEIAYNEDLRNHSPAYADIVSVEPVEEKFSVQERTVHLYCKGKLVDGDTVWVRFLKTQYVDLIDSSYSESEMSEKILFTTPLRLHGKVEVEGRIINAFEDNDILVLIVDSVDAL